MSLSINGARTDGHGGTVLKKGPWTATEDSVLVDYVRKNGEGNWNAVQKNTGLARCGKSCRLRWTNHLRPNLKKGAFTPEEEKLIIELHSQLGNKWARMAAQLPGRTDNEIKNYWNTRIKRRIRQGLPLYSNEVTSPRKDEGGGGEQKQQPPTDPKTEAAGAPLQEKLPTATGFHFQTPTLLQALNKRKAVTESRFHSSLALFEPSLNFSSTGCLTNPPLTPPDITAPRTPPPTTLQAPPALGSPSIQYKPYETSGFSLSFPNLSQSSPVPSSRTPTGPSQLTNLGIGMGSSFQFSPLAFSLSSPTSLKLNMDQMLPSKSVYSIKSELPSSQFYLPQIGKTESYGEKKPRIGRSNSGLLDSLLQGARGLASGENLQMQNFLNLQEKKLDESVKSIPQWDPPQSINSPSDPMNSMQANLSKLLHSIPSAIPVSEGCNPKEEMPKSQNSGNSSGLSDDGLGLDAHHIAALFPTDPIPENGRISTSFNWDNLPGIC